MTVSRRRSIGPTAGLDGLNPAAVAAHLGSTRSRFDFALEAVTEHIETHGGYVSWSGGKDSTVVVDLAHRVNPGIPVVWFDSGLEFPDNRAYIMGLAEEWTLNLHIIKAEPDALSILEQSGAWHHDREPDWSTPDLHDALVTTPARKARQAHGSAELWGLRAAESVARRALLTPGDGHITRADGTVVYSPVWAWRDLDINGYLSHRHIPENPVYARLRAAGATGKDLRVGLAVDGNNLNYGRITWLRRAFPEVYRHVENRLPRIREWT